MTAAIDLAARAAIVLALAWMAVALFHRHAASRRALIWTIAFGGLLALPLFARLIPAWHIAVWQTPLIIEAPRSEPALASSVVMTAEKSPRVDVPKVVLAGESESAPAPLTTVPAAPIDWSRVALLMSALITAFLLARIAASHVRMSRLLANAAPAGARWTDLIDEVRAARGIRRAVAARTSDAINVPAIAGVFRPTLILPSDASEWDGGLRRAVVLHELAHVARWDALAQLVEQIACAIYWFNPLAWHGAHRAAAFRERASDDEVIRAGVSGPAYAERLLDLVRGAGAADRHLATVAMARPSRMRERVVALLDPVARREALTMRTVLAAVMLSSCAVAAVAAAAPAPVESLILKPAALAMPDAIASRPAPPSSAPALQADGVPAPMPAPPAPEMPQPSSRLCGADLDNHQHMSGDRNGRKTLTIKLSGGGCTVDLKSEGRITFNDDFTDIAALDSGGFFRLEVKERDGTRRQLEIESRSGGLTRIWRVDGRELPYDEAARQWFAAFLIDLDRRTAIGVDVRLPRLLRQGGVNAVLDETGRMASDYVRNVYYVRLGKTATLGTADVTRMLQQAAKLTKSDHYANELLQAVAGRGLSDAAQRAAVTEMIGTMDSDHYIAEAVQVLVASGRPGGAEMDFLVNMLPRMKSDHYKVQVLTKVLNGATLTADQQAMLAKAASGIDNDHYAAEFLKTIASKGTMNATVRQSWLASVRNVESDHYASEILRTLIRTQRPQLEEIDSIVALAPSLQGDHYRTEVFSAVLELSELSERNLIGIVAAAKSMSDHYESETLRKVLRHARATSRVRDEALAAAEQLSSHYREEVRRSAGR